MIAPLAVVAPVAGAVSETFIRRHVENLLPGRTVALTTSACENPGRWSPSVPQLDVGRPASGLRARVGRHLRRRAGLSTRFPGYRDARAFLRAHGVEVMLCEYLDVASRWAEAAEDLRVRVVAHAHGHDVSSRLRHPQWVASYRALHAAAAVVTMSEYSRARLLEIGFDAKRLHVIPYGVTVPDVPPPARTHGNPVRLLAVGRAVAKKAPILLLDAFRRACESGPPMTLDVVGAGPLLPAAKQFVRAFSLDDVVTFHGAQPHEYVQALMQSADIFVQHSLTDDEGGQEGLPLAILEAMAAGLPVVSTRHAGIPEAVQDGRTGLLSPEADSVTMAAAIVTLGRDAAARSELGQAGWRTAASRFNWERQRLALLDVLGLSA